MAVNATKDTEVLTVNPTKVRYGLLLDTDKDGATRVTLQLQRSDKREDGTWLDDPRKGSNKLVVSPANLDVTAVKALVPTLATRLGITDPFTAYRAMLLSNLNPAGQLDVQVSIQALTAQGWKVKGTALSSFLTKPANQDIAAQVMGVWAAMDAAVDAANTTAKWL